MNEEIFKPKQNQSVQTYLNMIRKDITPDVNRYISIVTDIDLIKGHRFTKYVGTIYGHAEKREYVIENFFCPTSANIVPGYERRDSIYNTPVDDVDVIVTPSNDIMLYIHVNFEYLLSHGFFMDGSIITEKEVIDFITDELLPEYEKPSESGKHTDQFYYVPLINAFLDKYKE